MLKNCAFLVFVLVGITYAAYSQNNYQTIPMPAGLRSVNEEFSGMALWGNRVYLEPQYGSHKETGLNGRFNIYSIAADSITRVISGEDSTLNTYRTLNVINLNLLPDSVKKNYEGFEAITIANGQAYLSVETTDTYAYCFLLKGTIDTVANQITIDAKNFITLKRPLYIKNAGFEAVTYLPKEKKLLAMYEFNASAYHNAGYLVDPSFTQSPIPLKTPFSFFRITDITATNNGNLYAINYFYNGDYDAYLNNGIVENPESAIKESIPSLRDSLDKDYRYLKHKTFARVVKRNSYQDLQWKEVVTFYGYKNNWEGLVLFNNGALIITDANRSAKQASILAFVKF